MEPLKLLNEECLEGQTINESAEDKFMYIHGPFLGCCKFNRNHRMYSKEIISREVDKFQTLIKNREAVGELEHPETQKINPDRAAILITDLHMDGDFAVGKARVLKTPCGITLEGLIRGGVHMGVSSRGTGSLDNEGNVLPDFSLITIDSVLQPSCPDAYVEAVNESTQWVLDESTNLYIERKIRVDEANKKFNKKLSDYGSKAIVSAFREYMNAIKGC